MPAQMALAAYLPNFLLSCFRRTSSCFILRLPLDIHVDHIFVHLCVEDIICLRRVNKAFFLLTHEPVIWKRFLSHIKIPLPPLRPTFRYSLQATDFEVEQLVTRAVSLDDNWRKPRPDITSSQLMMAHYRVLDLKLLPGGKYLVASVRDAGSYRFYIMIFSLDHPKGHHALARVPTKAKAYHLQAKYMKYEGKQGIVIAYVRRTFRAGGPTNIDPSDYSFRTVIDPPYPFSYELVCLHIGLDSLELLADPEIRPGSVEFQRIAVSQPPPFYEVASLEAKFEMDNITLFDLNGMPHLSVVQQPNEIVIIDLERKIISTMICSDHEDHVGQPHRINAVRVLPGQSDILVIRSILSSGENNKHMVEIFDSPVMVPNGFTEREPKDRYFIDGQRASSFHISDYGIPTTTGGFPTLLFNTGPPPPISIFFRTTDPIGLIHHIVWPTHVHIPATATRGPSTQYYYSLEHVCWQTQHVSHPLITHVLPGAYRALMYTVKEDDRKDAPALVSLRRYVNPEFQHKDYPLPPKDNSTHILRKKRPPVPANIYCSFPLDKPTQQVYKDGGVAAITWDEGIGRVCIAAEKEDQIQILDFAHVVQPDARFARWKRNQTFILGGSQ